MYEVTQEMEAKARVALMNKMWEQMEGFTNDEVKDGAAGACAAVEIDGVWFYARTETSTGIPEGADIDGHLEFLCNEALDRMQDGQTAEEAERKFRNLYCWT